MSYLGAIRFVLTTDGCSVSDVSIEPAKELRIEKLLCGKRVEDALALLPPPTEQEINFVLLMEVVVPHIKVCRTNHVFHHNAVSFAVILGRITLNHAVQPCCFHEMLLFS